MLSRPDNGLGPDNAMLDTTDKKVSVIETVVSSTKRPYKSILVDPSRSLPSYHHP